MPLNVVATREFRQSLTAIGALLPGFIAFFGNCLRSCAVPGGGEEWRREYSYGASFEIYIVELEPG